MINDRKEAILFIAKKQHGGKKELIGEIGEKFYREPTRLERLDGQRFYALGV